MKPILLATWLTPENLSLESAQTFLYHPTRPATPGTCVDPTEKTLRLDSQQVYIKQWVRTKSEEHSQNLKFIVARNDGKRGSLSKLVGIRNFVVKQYPNMSLYHI